MADRSLDDRPEPTPSQEVDTVRVSISSSGALTRPDESVSDGPLDAARLARRERELLIRKNRKLAQIFGAESSLSPQQARKGSNVFNQTGPPPSDEETFLSPLVPNAESSYLENQEVVASESVPSLGASERTDEDGIEPNTSEHGRSLAIPPSPFVVSTAERRQKITRLAKLHRYLGSGVPAERVFGITEFMRDLDLPPPSGPEDPRRSSPVEGRENPVDLSSSNSGDANGISPKMSDVQRVAQVRRASKMEKLFGDRPPQELLHARSPPSHVSAASQMSDTNELDRSFHKSKTFSTKARPGTADSSESAQRLLAPESETFRTYRDSINSIRNIAERDDAQSLVSVHQLLTVNYEDDGSPSAEHNYPEDRVNSTKSSKSERRRSLPVTRKDSLSSLHSSVTASSPPPEVVNFQLRRRRAAKLVDFFGVDYRVLFDSVLSTLELGVEEETSRGTLRPDETEILMNKLRALRVKDDKRRFLG